MAASAIADRYDDDAHTQAFGCSTAALSLGFVLGPLLGGCIGNPEAGGGRGPGTAFAVDGVLNLGVVAVFWALFSETLEPRHRDRDGFAMMRSFRNASEALVDRKRRPIYAVLLCFILAYARFSRSTAWCSPTGSNLGPGTPGCSSAWSAWAWPRCSYCWSIRSNEDSAPAAPWWRPSR